MRSSQSSGGHTREVGVPLNCEQDNATAPFPRLLFVSEYPPSNHHGGAILLRRLLDKHPADCLSVITSTPGMKDSQALDLLPCGHIAMPMFGGSRYRWFRRLKDAANFLLLAVVALRAILEIRRRRIAAVISVIGGQYYLAAGLACWVIRAPHIAVVHDNFVSSNTAPWSFLVETLRRLTASILKGAAHIYCVSPEMQRLVFSECGRESELQLPSTTWPVSQMAGPDRGTRPGGPIILFAGKIEYTVRDNLELLAKLIATGQLRSYDVSDAKFYLCTTMTDEERRNRVWDDPSIVIRGWMSQSELREELRRADILFLPYSFSEGSRGAVEAAFPSKAADYLAAGKPVLVFGPKNSTLVRYASEQGFAEIVDEFSAPALARGIQNIESSPPYGERLAARAREVFSTNHDIKIQRQKFYATLHQIIKAEVRKIPVP